MSLEQKLTAIREGARQQIPPAAWTTMSEATDTLRASGIMDGVIAAASKAGKNLTTDAFIKALDSLTIPPDMFGADQMSYSPTKHLGSNKSRLSQIKDGKWTVITPYVEP
jgi:hypothetical protein